MNLYHDIETENYCNYQNSLINMVSQILQQKFLKTEIEKITQRHPTL